MLARTMRSRSLGLVTFCGSPSQPTGDSPHRFDELSCHFEGAHVAGTCGWPQDLQMASRCRPTKCGALTQDREEMWEVGRGQDS